MNAKLCFRFILVILLVSNLMVAAEQLPFRMAGNLILVEATVNNLTGEFIIDTGAPELILNQSYFDGINMSWAQMGVIDLCGSATPTEYVKINNFSLGSIEFAKQFAFAIDLVSLEEIKNSPIMGIIGYDVLKDLEILFDFDYQVLEFVKVKNRKCSSIEIMEPPTAKFDLKFCGHLPYIIMKVDNKRLRMGIDTGAEVNVLNKMANGKVKVKFVKASALLVKSISQNQRKVDSGFINGATINDYQIGRTQMALLSMLPMNNSLPIDLDGFLGVPFLKKGRISLNYKKRELCVWPPSGTLASQETVDVLEVNAED